MLRITPELLLQAYAIGVFPMAESAEDEHLYWFDPHRRGIIPLERFYVPKRLRKTVRRRPYTITVDRAFPELLAACAERSEHRPETWINRPIRDLYTALHEAGYAHSVEAWDGDGALAGGLYGVALGGAFFGESMVSRGRDASKIALVYLIARLQAGGYSLLDTQFVTRHLARFGAMEIGRDQYQAWLSKAVEARGDFYALDRPGQDSEAAVTALLDAMAGRPPPTEPTTTADESMADYLGIEDAGPAPSASESDGSG